MLNEHSTKPDTREKILQAAFTVLSRQGYENTSIKDIAEEAGVAQGLVHYHYKSKQQLVVEVLAYVCKKIELNPGRGEQGALEAFALVKQMARNSRDTHALFVQLIGVGLHDELVGAAVREFVHTDLQHAEEIVRDVLSQRGQEASAARGIAGAVWGAVLGIKIQSLVDPEFDADEAIDALAAMSLTAVFPEARSRSQA